MIPSAVVALVLSTCLDACPAHACARGDSGCKPSGHFHGLCAPFFHLVNGGGVWLVSPSPKSRRKLHFSSSCTPSSALRWPGYCLVWFPVGQAHGVFGGACRSARLHSQGNVPQTLFISHEGDKPINNLKQRNKKNTTTKHQLFYGPFNDGTLY